MLSGVTPTVPPRNVATSSQALTNARYCMDRAIRVTMNDDLKMPASVPIPRSG